MKFLVKNHLTRAALIAGMAAAAWAPNSFACSDTPILASVCIMAVPTTFGSFNRQFVLADGRLLPINSYTALYSLIGATYGGDTRTNFNLPDLRNRFVVGADGSNYLTGATGGKDAIALTVAQLPAHMFTLTAVPVDVSKITVKSTLPTLTGTAAVASAVATGTVADLKMNVSTNGNGLPSPAGNYLGRGGAASAYLYSSATPDATLNAGAISGGTVSVTVPASTTTVTIPGGPLTGVVGGTASATGNTNIVGSNATIDIRPSYIAMTYYIAVSNGLYPSRD